MPYREHNDWFSRPFWEQSMDRAVAALAADPGVMRRTGHTLAVGSLAREYGFTDVDGRQPTAYPIVR